MIHVIRVPFIELTKTVRTQEKYQIREKSRDENSQRLIFKSENSCRCKHDHSPAFYRPTFLPHIKIAKKHYFPRYKA